MKIEIRTTKLTGTEGNVRGLSTVTFDGKYAVRNISIVESKKGGLFVSMPSYKLKELDPNGKTQFKDIAYPVTKEFREMLYGKIMESYKEDKNLEFTV